MKPSLAEFCCSPRLIAPISDTPDIDMALAALKERENRPRLACMQANTKWVPCNARQFLEGLHGGLGLRKKKKERRS